MRGSVPGSYSLNGPWIAALSNLVLGVLGTWEISHDSPWDTSKLPRDGTPLQCLVSPLTPTCSDTTARMGEDQRVSSFTNSPGPFTAPAAGVDSEDSLIQLVPVVLDTRVGGPENQLG